MERIDYKSSGPYNSILSGTFDPFEVGWNLVRRLSLEAVKRREKIVRNIFLCIIFVVGLTFTEASKANDCVVTDWKISAKVQNKKPLDVRNTFTVKDSRVSAYVRINCTQPVQNTEFCFYRNKAKYACVKLSVKSPEHWRTWASVKALKGSWMVRLRIDEREMLTDKFLVQ